MASRSLDQRIVRSFRFARQRLTGYRDEGLEGFAPQGRL
jgi:hypothetical protein